MASGSRATDTLLLCSDGLNDELTDAEIYATLARHEPQAAAEHLVAQANAVGGRDNITVLVMRWARSGWRQQRGPCHLQALQTRQLRCARREAAAGRCCWGPCLALPCWPGWHGCFCCVRLISLLRC